ncbi:J domain-containing protein-like isoform X1 [Penaeus japonicus]|uniref:J domain-containing protein-like isoform X1 n=1 Tax=Penaeus japonicus TaxID=27405 RepID=UPI001C70ECD2|nr:J domain-containing protein-like isoform X1 [Penaeus japonicus]
MEAILSSDVKKDENYYTVLGCDPSSSVEQIQAEYKVRALQLHPDKNPDDPEAEEKFQKLQIAKDTLCDPEQRVKYDKWLNSGLAISYEQWSGMPPMTTTLHWATPNTKERMLEPGTSQAQAGGQAGQPHAPPPVSKPGSRRASEQVSHILHGRTKETVRVPRPSEVWERDTSEVMKKFRNYEI